MPMHSTAFIPTTRCSRPPTDTTAGARSIAWQKGLRFVYTGNVHNREGGSTHYAECGALVIERNWYSLGSYALTDGGRRQACGARLSVFAGRPGSWGPRRLPVRL